MLILMTFCFKLCLNYLIHLDEIQFLHVSGTTVFLLILYDDSYLTETSFCIPEQELSGALIPKAIAMWKYAEH